MNRFGRYARILICAGLIYVVVYHIDTDQLKNIYLNIQPSYVFVILLLIAVQMVVKAYKWNILMKAKGFNIPTRKIFQLDYVSSFLSLFFPSTISVDIFRGYGLSRDRSTKEVALPSIITDRWVSLAALLFAASIGALLFHDLINNNYLVCIVFSLLLLFVLVTLVVCNRRWDNILTRHRSMKKGGRVLDKLNSLRQSVFDYRKHRSILLTVFLLSLLIQLCRILIYFSASLAFNKYLPIEYYFAFVPVMLIVIMLPISLAGVGVREGAFVYFFSKVGMTTVTAFAISSLVSILVLAALIPGGVLYAVKGLALRNKCESSLNE